MSLEIATSLAPVIPLEHLAPHILRTSEHALVPPVGVSYLGGIALFNPQPHLLSRREQSALVYAIVGTPLSVVARHERISERTAQIALDNVYDKLDVNHPVGLADRALDPAKGTMLFLKKGDNQIDALLSELEQDVLISASSEGGTPVAIVRQILGMQQPLMSEILHTVTSVLQTDKRELHGLAISLSGKTGLQLSYYPTAQAVARSIVAKANTADRTAMRSIKRIARALKMSEPVPTSEPQTSLVSLERRRRRGLLSLLPS